MSAVLTALAAGIVVGVVFALVRVPPPAPQTAAGVAGIVGIVAAWALTTHLLTRGGTQ